MSINGPTRGAKGDMFEGGIHVPCALNMPGVFEGGRRDNHFVVMMDLMPTICDFVNVPVRHEIDGISVLDAIKRKKQNTEDRFVFWLRNEGGPQFGGKSQSAVRYNEYKLLQNKYRCLIWRKTLWKLLHYLCKEICFEN